jgi:hypothetical protein
MKDSTTKVVMVGLVFLVFTAPLFLREADLVVLGKNDFIPLYVAAKSSPSELYNPQTYQDFQMAQFSGFSESLRFTRLPFYAILLKPLGLLSYHQAYLVWVLLRLGAVIMFVFFWPHESRGDVAFMTCLSLSIAVALANGQDSLLLLLFVTLAVRWHTSRPIAAGLSLSLCAIKFHLFILLPLLLLAQRRWRLLQGFMAGAAILLALSFFGGGWNWPSAYFDTLTDSRVHPGLAHMPNLHGLFSNFPLEMASSVVILVAAWFAMQRTNFVFGLAVALTGGIPLSYHSYVADCVLLTPVVLILFAHTRVAWLKVMGVSLVSPLLPLMLLHHSRPFAYPMQVTLLLFFFSLAFVLPREPRRALEAKPA